MTIRFVEESFSLKDGEISISIFNLENAALVLVTDKKNEYCIGNIALATPITGGTKEIPPSVFTLFGGGQGLLAKAIAGRMSTKIGKPVLSIVGLKEDDLSTISVVLKATQDTLTRFQPS